MNLKSIAIGVFCAALAPLAALANPLTAEISSVGALAAGKLPVTVAFSGTARGGEHLFLVYDTCSASRFEDWTHRVDCGEIAPDEAIRTYEIDCTEAGGFVRAYVTADDSYLETTDGKAYVNLEHILVQGESYSAKIKTGAAASGSFWMLVGAYGGASSGANQRSSVFQYSGSGQGWEIGYNQLYSSGTGQSNLKIKCANNTIYWLEATFGATRQSMRAGVSPVALQEVAWLQSSAAAANTTAPLYLFARNCDQNANKVDNICPAGTRFYSLTISNGSGAIKHFVPAMKDDQPCVHELVNDTYHFALAGTLSYNVGETRYETAGDAVRFGSYKREIESVEIINGGSQVRVTLEAGKTDDELALCVGYGTRDYGPHEQDWPVVNKVATIHRDDISFVFDVDEQWGTAYTVLRVFVILVANPAIDGQVGYLETDGTSYINLEHIAVTGEKYMAKMRTGAAASTAGWIFLGAYKGASTASAERSVIFQHSAAASVGWEFGYNELYASLDNQSASHTKTRCQNSTDYWLTTDLSIPRLSFCADTSANGQSEVGWIKTTDPCANTTAPLYLFARNCDQNAIKVDNICPAGTRFYSLEIYNGERRVKMFVPCVKNDRPCVHEVLSGSDYFAAVGTMTAGGDPVPVEFKTQISGSSAIDISPPEPGRIDEGSFAYSTGKCPDGTPSSEVTVSAGMSSLGEGALSVWANWGFGANALQTWTPLVVNAATEADGLSFAGLLDVRGPRDVYCRLVSSNFIERTTGTYRSGDATTVFTLPQVGGKRLRPSGLIFMLR